MTQAEAAQTAGYRGGRAAASRRARDPVVREELERLASQTEGEAIVTRQEVLTQLTKQFNASLADYVDIEADGLPRFNLSRAKKARQLGLVAALKMGRAENGREFVRELRLPDRLAVVDRLARMHGWYQPEKVEHSGKVDIAKPMLSDEEEVALIAEEIARVSETPAGRAARLGEKIEAALPLAGENVKGKGAKT
jgi:hypothetical protein